MILEAYTDPAVKNILRDARQKVERIVQRPLSIGLVEVRNKPAFVCNSPKVDAEKLRLQNIICNVCGVYWWEITGKSRKKNIVVARQMYCVYARTFLKKSLVNIGYDIEKDHTTVIHSLQTVQNMLDTDDQLWVEKFERINQSLYA